MLCLELVIVSYLNATCHCSFLAHKEFRFVLPILPLAMHICGYYITCLHQQIQKVDQASKSQLEVITEEQVSKQLDAVRNRVTHSIPCVLLKVSSIVCV